MDKKCIPVRSATLAFMGEAKLKEKGYSVSVGRSASMADGCGYCLWVESAKKKEATDLLSKNGIKTER